MSTTMSTTMSNVTEVSTGQVFSTPQTGKRVHSSHYVTYHYILPILVCMGVLANAVCILVLSRPRLRAIKISRSVNVRVDTMLGQTC